VWTQFAAMVGGSSAGLASLVFLVVAFRFDTIATSTEYRNRAAQVLVLFLTTTVSASLVAVPQAPWMLGVELVMAAVAAGIVLVRLDRAAGVTQPTGNRRRAVAGMLVTLIALAGAGVLVAAGIDAGMYGYAAAGVTALIFGVNGAWVFLTAAAVEPGGHDVDGNALESGSTADKNVGGGG